MEKVYDCPFCVFSALTGFRADRKGHLHVNPVKNVYHCFRCMASGKSTDLTTLGAPRKTYAGEAPALPMYPVPGVLVQDIESPLVQRIVKTYLVRERGMTEGGIIKYGVRYVSSRNAIAFPVYGVPGGVPLWYQTRQINGHYMMPKGCRLANFTIFRTFGIPYLISRVEFCILTEGVFDAISVGRTYPAVAVFGKNAPDTRLAVLGKLANKVIVMLDPDAKDHAPHMAIRLRSLGIPAVVADTSTMSHDPGDSSDEEIAKVVEEARL